MTFTAIPYTFPLWAALLLSLALARFAWSRRNAAGALPLAAMTLLMAIWSFGYIVELLSPDLDSKIAWDNVQILGGAVGAGLLAFSLEHISGAAEWRKRYIGLLAFPPLMIWMIAWVVPEYWLRLAPRLDASGPIPALVYDLGPWLWMDAILGYVFILFSIALLIWHLLHSSGAYRRQTMVALLGVVLALAAISLFFFDVLPPYLRDPSPLAFTLLNLLLAWSISRYGLFDLVPIARSRVIEEMRDGLIVLDARGRIVDINPAAAHIIGAPGLQAVGRTARDVFSPWPHLIERFRAAREAREAVVIGTGNGQRNYEVSISSMTDHRDRFFGRVIILRELASHTPRFGPAAAEATVPVSRTQPEAGTRRRIPLISWLVDFFLPPMRTDLEIPPDVEPKWYRLLERTFTMFLRFAALLSPVVTLLSGPDFGNFRAGYYAFLAFDLCLAALAVTRAVSFNVRVIGFVLVFYAFGLTETIAFGYSAESFIFFVIVVVSAGLLVGRKGALAATVASLGTLGVLGWLIMQGYFVPLAVDEGQFASSPPLRPIPILFSFAASVAGLSMLLAVMWENVYRAMEREKQALNLLQQERDHLDQRVKERSRDLFESEAKYRTLVEQLPAVVYRNEPDASGACNYISPQIEGLLGYSAVEWAKDPYVWEKTIHPGDRERALAAIDETLRQGQATAEYRLLSRDRREVWVRDDSILVHDDAGVPLFVQGTMRDITALKQVAETLRVSEERYRLLAENVTDTIWTTDLNLRFTYISPSVKRHRGFSVEEAMSQTLAETLPPSSLEKAMQVFAEAMETTQGKTPEARRAASLIVELENYCKDGSIIPVESILSFILDPQGEPVGILGASRNITERKRAEEQIRTLSQAVEQSADSIVITGKDGDIEYVNPKFEEVTGYSFEEARGKNPRILKSGEHPPEFYEDLWKTITVGKAWRGVLHNKRKDGSLYWESAAIAPILDHNGAITNYVAVKEDVTARKEAEENLNRALIQLEQSNSELKTFAYAISHDLQEPLRMVSSYVQLLARRYRGKLDSDAAEFIGFAVEGADRMKKLIDNLLEYSRIGTHGKEFIKTDCNQVLRQALGNLQLTIEESGAQVVAGSLPEVLADETQLVALFQNLVGNAVKFHGKEKPYVHIRAEAKGADWIFAVQDNGIGIDPQYTERIFEVFQRLHTREEYPGTGIGLALCKRIVERHGGKIWVESQSGHGATFYFTIPMVNRN